MGTPYASSGDKVVTVILFLAVTAVKLSDVPI